MGMEEGMSIKVASEVLMGLQSVALAYRKSHEDKGSYKGSIGSEGPKTHKVIVVMVVVAWW